MGTNQNGQSLGCGAAAAEIVQEKLTPDQLRDLSDSAKQEQYRAAYRLQQARMSCPGCGDDGSVLCLA